MRAVEAVAEVEVAAEAEVKEGTGGTEIPFFFFWYFLVCWMSYDVYVDSKSLERAISRSVSRSRSASPIKSSRCLEFVYPGNFIFLFFLVLLCNVH